ncbi:MAG TPA: hypothetical protein VIG49_01465 [Acetobacteraceae bacterium]|jgi:hypothetical protein
MADHSTSTTFTGPQTQEAFLADRQRFWQGFTSATLGAVVFMAILLIAMGLFL